MLLPIFFILTTLLILIFGILLMARGGEANEKYSNKLMIARVVLQVVALLSIGILYYLKYRSG